MIECEVYSCMKVSTPVGACGGVGGVGGGGGGGVGGEERGGGGGGWGAVSTDSLSRSMVISVTSSL